MTHKKLIHRRIRRLIYFILLGLSYAGIFVFMDNDFLACSSLILSIAFLFLFIMTFSNKYKHNIKLEREIRKSIFANPVSLNDINLMYRFKGLESVETNILKLFFHKDGTKRCVVYKESNAVKISFERLEYFDDNTKYWTSDFAQWVSDGIDSGIYADEQTAINDNIRFLDDYVEEKTQIIKRTSHNAEIEWKNITLQSKLIPFGSYNSFDIKIKDRLIENVIIHNNNWLDMSTSNATLYIEEKYNIESIKKFYILKNNEVIGVGYY